MGRLSEEAKRKISIANTGKKRTPGARLKMRLAKLGKPLSEEHKQKLRGRVPWIKGRKTGIVPRSAFKKGHKINVPPEKRLRGSKHPNWKGGISLNREDRRSLEYIAWRNEIYRRGFWHCVACGKKCRKGDIIAHHIAPVAESPSRKLDLENGALLCRGCHLRVHKNLKVYKKQVVTMSIEEKYNFVLTEIAAILKAWLEAK